MGTEVQRRIAHVLCIPIDAYGHSVPMLRLCKEIARKEMIAFTFFLYEDFIARTIQEESNSDLESLGIRFIGLKLSDAVTFGSPQLCSQELEKSFKPLVPQLLNDRNSGVLGSTSILSDMFLTWTQDVADQLQIPRYMFVPSGCILARSFQCCAENFAQGKFKISKTEDKLEEFEGTIAMPGLPALSYHELPATLRCQAAYDEERCKSVWTAAGVLINSFDELEPKALEAWRQPHHPGFEKTEVPKIYPVGPIDLVLSGTFVGKSEDSLGSRSLAWLDSQPPSSVLYIAFGTWVSLSAEDIIELALGLESSNQRFFWVLSSSTDLQLPSGFKERVGDRGFFWSGWAPQVQILAHSATGAFLTHAGWNSSLEGVVMGLPMITCPVDAEQHLNSRYFVDEAKIALELRKGAEMILERKEVERVVCFLMYGESAEAKAVRGRAAILKIKAAEAVSAGGSRLKAVEDFTTDLLSRSEKQFFAV